MIPVAQTLLGPTDGNCLPACVASILELDLSAVPNFCAGEDDGNWVARLASWLAEDGWCAVHCCFVHEDPGVDHDQESIDFIVTWMKRRKIGYAIVNGYTERGLPHSTVWNQGELVHDPHPDPLPLLNMTSVIVLAPLDPRRP